MPLVSVGAVSGAALYPQDRDCPEPAPCRSPPSVGPGGRAPRRMLYMPFPAPYMRDACRTVPAHPLRSPPRRIPLPATMPTPDPSPSLSQPSILSMRLLTFPSPSTSSTPSASPRPAVGSTVRLVRDQRFGPDGYVRAHTKCYYHAQLPTTTPLPGPDTTGAAIMVDIHDVGFATELRDAQGCVTSMKPVLRSGVAVDDHDTDAFVCYQNQLFPALFSARIVRLPDAIGLATMEFVGFSFTKKIGCELQTHTRWLPFGSYQNQQGNLVGAVQIGKFYYQFHATAGHLPLPERDRIVTLTRATKREIQFFSKYQSLYKAGYKRALENPDAITMLSAAPAPLAEKFDRAMDRAEKLLVGALEVFVGSPEVARAFCARFAGGCHDAAAVATVTRQVHLNVQALLARFSQLRRQAAHVVGFYRCEKRTGTHFTSGISIVDAMTYPLDYRYIAGPLMAFNTDFFLAPTVLCDDLAALLLHEYSHACLGTTDATHAPYRKRQYADDAHACHELQPLIDAASRVAGGAAFHASTLEHIIMLLAYWCNPASRWSALQFLEGATTYQRYFDEGDFSDIAEKMVSGEVAAAAAATAAGADVAGDAGVAPPAAPVSVLIAMQAAGRAPEQAAALGRPRRAASAPIGDRQ